VEAAMSSGPVGEAVARVEAQLSAFWSTPSQDEGPEEPKVRASTMNYIVVGAPTDTAKLAEAVERVAEARAGRMFIATLDGRLPPWDLSSDVSAVCHKEGEQVVCYDRIELTFGAMAAARVASVIGALALGEVPTILEVARGAPGALVDPLASACERLVVDSSHTPVSRIAELAQRSRAPIGDRAFVRTFSWRELVARFFDDIPEATRAIRRVEIEHTPDGKNGTAALIFGWLASRLGWTFEGSVAKDARGEPVELALKDAPPREGLLAGDITAIRIEASLRGAPLALQAERSARDLRAACWSRRGAKSDAHELPLGYHDETWVLFKAIDASAGDRLYRESIERAAALCASDWSGQ